MNTIRKASYKCIGNGHNKEYHFQMIEKDGLYVIDFQYGAIGQSLKIGTKPKNPLDLDKANKLFESMIKERLSKGYSGGESSDAKNDFTQSSAPQEPKKVYEIPQLLNAIDEAEVERLISDDDYMAQEKKDGERRMVKSSNKILGLNKKGQEVSLPDEIINAVKDLELHVDGENIGNKLHAFDILSLNGVSTKETSAEHRIKILTKKAFNNTAIEVVYTAFTTEEKRALYEKLKAENREGIVFKKKSATYKPGRPNKGGDQLKFKFQKTASFMAGEITEGKRSVSLFLFDESKTVFMGKCTIPPNKEIPNMHDVIEVQYLYCYFNGCVFQPVYIGKRNDVTQEECTLDQIVYKAKNSDDGSEDI